MPLLYLDTETYSEVPLRTHGTHAYAEDCEIIMWQYAVDDGPVIVEEHLTTELREMLLNDAYEIVIHNSHFDRTVIRHCTGIDIPTSRIFDTMVCAMTVSLPGALDKLCDILGVAQDKAKDKDGKRLINVFCKPQKLRNGTIKRTRKEDKPEDWVAFCEYGRLDIEAMREVKKLLPIWNYKGQEKELWELDQEINDLGAHIDLDLAHSAIRAAKRAQAEYAEETKEKTDGEVTSTNRRDVLLQFFRDRFDIKLPDLKSATVKRLLEANILPEEVLDLLEIRLEASKTSTAKYNKVVNATSKDGRLKGLLQFCGASRTGRWAGRLFQPQNLPRPTIESDELEDYISQIKSNSEGLIDSDYTVMEMCSSALRGLITAPANKKLVIADLSNIEGRVLAWLASERWKIKAFSDFDKKAGYDLYNLTYAKAFGVDVETVTKDQRQIGKVMELAFGYGGGVGAWITFATAYGIDLEKLAEKGLDNVPADIIAQSQSWHKKLLKDKKSTYGLSERAFVMCDSFKRLWRDGHENVVAYWKNLEIAVTSAINNPSKTYVVNMHKIRVDGAWLRIGLPSGRCLCYPRPAIIDGKITYEGLNQFTRKWERLNTYGGKLAENITQATARDVLAHGMLILKKIGYKTFMTVHDEILTEAPDTPDFNVEKLIECMTAKAPWFIDLPLAAAGFECYRYRK